MKNIEEHINNRLYLTFESLSGNKRVDDEEEAWWATLVNVRWEMNKKVNLFRRVMVTV